MVAKLAFSKQEIVDDDDARFAVETFCNFLGYVWQRVIGYVRQPASGSGNAT